MSVRMSTVRKLLERDGEHCLGCGVRLAHPLVPDSLVPVAYPPGGETAAEGHRFLQVDHVIPQSAGGTNHLGNYELVCSPCNIDRYWAWKRQEVAG